MLTGPPARARLAAIAQTLAVLAAMALTAVLAKQALGAVPPFTFAWLHVGVGALVLTAWTFGVRREPWPRGLSRETWSTLAWLGVGNFALVRVLFMFSLERLPASTQAYLVNFVGLITMAMSAWLLRERPTWVQVAGAVVALAGLRVFFPDLPPPRERLGVLQLAAGIVVLASTNVAARKLALDAGERLSSTMVSTLALWIGGAPLVLAGLASDWPPRVPTASDWGVIAANGVVGIAVGLTVWNHVLRTLRSYEASVLGSTSVVWVALFAVPLLGERLLAHQVGGIALMLVGLALVQLRGAGR